MRDSKTTWIDTWAAALHPDDSHRQFWGNICFPLDRGFRNATIRQQVRIANGGDVFRFHISNEFSDSEMPLTRMTVALPSAHNGASPLGSSMILPDTVKAVTFDGFEGVIIPPGVTWISDPVAISLRTGADLTISLYLAEGQSRGPVAGHEMAKTTSWLALGDHTSAESLPPSSFPTPFSRWYYITGVERAIGAEEEAATLICIGDSITDQGDRAWDTNQYLGWPNLLAKRIRSTPSLSYISLLNCGISGDQLWRGGLKRLERDVITRSGVKYLFILMGINDLGNVPDLPEDQEQLYHRLVGSYQQIITKCRKRDIAVFASTITPFLTATEHANKQYTYREQTRMRVNDWIRNEASFDYVVDWSKVLTLPTNSHVMNEKYQYNDAVHPNLEACQVMADAVDLGAFLVDRT